MRRVGHGGGDTEKEEDELPESSNILHLYHNFYHISIV